MGTNLSSPDKLPDVDLTGKTIIVTGANTGIGYQTAKSLAQVGAQVILACRSEIKANEAIERMREEHGDEKGDERKCKVKIKADDLKLEFMSLDLASLASTMTFVEAYKVKGYPLHVLICNAGILWGPKELTEDGFEPHFQVNYLSHFLLILHLLPVLKASGPGVRVVLVSALLYRISSRWNPADLQLLEYEDGQTRYSTSKLYQLMQMFSLADRLVGSGVSVFSLHPGVPDTELVARGAEGQQVPWLKKMLTEIGRTIHLLRNPFDGALTTLHAAANPAYDGQTAIYFEDSKPKPGNLTHVVRNKGNQELLWKYSIDCLGDYVTEEILREFTSTPSGPCPAPSLPCNASWWTYHFSH